MNVPVDPDILIDKIYINPSLPVDADELIAKVKNKSLSCEVLKSKIKE